MIGQKLLPRTLYLLGAISEHARDLRTDVGELTLGSVGIVDVLRVVYDAAQPLLVRSECLFRGFLLREVADDCLDGWPALVGEGVCHRFDQRRGTIDTNDLLLQRGGG